jgi:GT2 family glycosyltransferase
MYHVHRIAITLRAADADAAPMHPRTSIVMLTLNELEYTQRCIDSIRRHATGPYELVLVDNGSTDGTVEWLRALAADPAAGDVTVIENGANLGFGGGCNVGIAAATGERVLLLNNDTVATAGWLDALHAALDADPRRGVVGPRSNHVAAAQKVDDVPYDVWSLDGLDDFAAAFTAEHAGEGADLQRLIGFCMLLPREVFERIGGFDLRFGAGNFEDDDLCLRIRAAGWTCWMAGDSFVHHFGSRTFAGAKISYSTSMADNWARFERKWRVPGIVDDAGRLIGYDATAMLAHARFDAARDVAPVVGVPDDGSKVTIERRGTAVLACADPGAADDTRERLRAALAAFGPEDDVTVVVRVDPADAASLELLEAAADEVAPGELPDVTVVLADARNDAAVLRACDAAICSGARGWTLAVHAGLLGVAAWTLEDLAGNAARAAA